MKQQQDPFKTLKQAMNEGKERWSKIEELTKELKNGISDSPTGRTEKTISLLSLLIEHLRPLYSAQDQNIDFEAILKKLLKK